ncbi:lipase 1 [Manduca sexta]|uniref:lipase 1 n=1 Tax=Manduca sexta TaxID=7130 RepID=UPI00188DDB4F|nr:lipase 1 [Manduca sexta]
MSVKTLGLFVTISIIINKSFAQIANITTTLSNVAEDGLLNFTELAEKYGYPANVHDVTTEDGYKLKLFNIPGDKSRPVLLVHGVFGTADDYIIRGNSSLAIILAKLGFDVWAMNVRGCRYSRNHRFYNPDNGKDFWDYSVHELGVYDLASNVDYVLNETGQSQLSIVGFSEGTTMTIVLGSEKPEYNSKIKVFIALAPICHLQNAVGPLASLIRVGTFLDRFLAIFNVEEVLGYSSVAKGIMNLLCTQLPISFQLCMDGTVAPLIGANSDDIEKEFFPIAIAHFPAGTSRKNLVHFAQIGSSKIFGQFDYGRPKNYNMYKSFTPPNYDLSKVTMDVVLVSGKNDRVSTLEDTELLKEKLPNVKEHIILQPESFNHLDHMWGRSCSEVSYPYIVQILESYN